MEDNRKPARFIREPFKAMTDEDIDLYMKTLQETQGAMLTGVEKQVEWSLRAAASQRASLTREYNGLQQRIQQIRTEDENLSGQMDAFIFILQKAEDDRRWAEQQKDEDNDVGQRKDSSTESI